MHIYIYIYVYICMYDKGGALQRFSPRERVDHSEQGQSRQQEPAWSSCICMYICIHVYMYNTYIYIYIYIYTHTYHEWDSRVKKFLDFPCSEETDPFKAFDSLQSKSPLGSNPEVPGSYFADRVGLSQRILAGTISVGRLGVSVVRLGVARLLLGAWKHISHINRKSHLGWLS